MYNFSNDIINKIGTYVHKHEYFLNQDWYNDTRILNKENYNNFKEKKNKIFKNKSLIIQKFIKNTNFQIPDDILSMQHFKNKKLRERMRIYAIRLYVKEYSDKHLLGDVDNEIMEEKELKLSPIKDNELMISKMKELLRFNKAIDNNFKMTLPFKIQKKCNDLKCITKKEKRGNIKEWPDELHNDIYWQNTRRGILNVLIKYCTSEELGCYGF